MNNNFRYYYHDCCAECECYDLFNGKCLSKLNSRINLVSPYNSICDLFEKGSE